MEGAHETLKQVAAAGIDLDKAMQELRENEGVASFAKSFENLKEALVNKHKSLSMTTAATSD